MLLPRLFKRDHQAHTLAVSMTGVKMGDSVVFLGCANGGWIAATAGKVGLSGRALAVVPDEAAAERARKGAASLGVLLDIAVAPLTSLPVDSDTVDVMVVDDTGGLMDALRADQRAIVVHEIFRILRRGGRVVIVGSAARTGLAALLARTPAGTFTATGGVNAALEAGGFRSVRTLAEREGLVFVEGLKPRVP